MDIVKSRIEKNLFIYIIIATIFVSAAASIIMAAQYYFKELADTRTHIEMLKGTMSEPIARSLWMFDTHQITAELNSIVSISRIDYAAVVDESGVMYFSGKVPKGAKMYEIPIYYTNNNKQLKLGKLTLAVNSQLFNSRDPKKLLSFAFFESFKIIIIALSITFIIHLYIIRHLPKVSSYIRSISTTEPQTSLTLNRMRNYDDELDEITASLNDLRKNLHSTENERRINEEQLTGSLKEKEVLIKEIHHRVKNNLQIISSLMTLQEKYGAGKDISSTLLDMKLRIKSMALIHEKIYHSNNFNSIDFRDFTVKMLRDIAISIGSKREIDLQIEIPDILLSLDHAVPFALILNEILTNAYKFAFPDSFTDEPKIQIKMTSDEKTLSAIITDNGIGIPEGVNLQSAESMGVTLIFGLLKQIGATHTLESRPQFNGTSWNFSFKL